MMKAAVQGALSLTPNPQRWNRLLQKYVTRSLDLTEEVFDEKWRMCQRHASHWTKRTGRSLRGIAAVELGTGWYPIVPIGLALSGAGRVVTIDVQDLLTREQVVETLTAFDRVSAYEPTIDRARLRRSLRLAREPAVGVREILAEIGVRSVVADIGEADMPPASIDLVTSNNTFEHVRPEKIDSILRALRRLAHERTVMSHHVDMADHYANFDASIGVLNFLRFSERTWTLFNNELQYQNRLRPSDYVALFERAGWDVRVEEPRRVPAHELESMAVAPEFRDYDRDDLSVYEAWFVSQPQEGHGP